MMNLLRLSATFVAGAFLLACGGGNDCETPNPDYDPLNPASEFCLDTPESLMPGSTLADSEEEESESSLLVPVERHGRNGFQRPTERGRR